MKAIQAIYEGGQIRPIEPVPDVKSASVLVIFPDVSEGKGEEEPSPTDLEAKLFGAGVDLWTDEVDAAVKEAWQIRTRPPEMEPPWDRDVGENGDAAL